MPVPHEAGRTSQAARVAYCCTSSRRGRPSSKSSVDLHGTSSVLAHAMNAAAGGVGGASAVPSRLGLCIWLSAFQPARGVPVNQSRRRHWLSAAAATTLVAEIPAGLGRIWSVAQVKGLGAAPLLRPFAALPFEGTVRSMVACRCSDAAFTVGDLLVAVALFAAILAGLV
ncbi:hypothetical protein FB45DRAFT_879912 [Roridomyces roridus]|uniref:Uncharacterized protein n=1 Tax=Roridomyces roridus TaxID=1738132 RepID=A0AAD7F9D1_9AGAR|nr:hypothetical protein FB45DRAFT_879912 [Roridomyces roridus]